MKSLIFIFTLLIISTISFGQNLIEAESPYAAEVTLNRLRENVKNKGLNVFTEIDHSQAAQKSNMKLDPTFVLIFGNPKVGTRLMQADPRLGIELPLKILVYENNGITQIAYVDPVIYGEIYNLKEQEDILQNMSNLLKTIVAEVVKP